jgi:hypothetical protein
MARLSIALALIALLVGHAVASTGSDALMGAVPTPVTIGVAPGPLPEHDFASKHLAKISGNWEGQGGRGRAGHGRYRRPLASLLKY